MYRTPISAAPLVNPEERARGWQAARYLQRCANITDFSGGTGGTFSDGRSEEQMDNGNVFQSAGNSFRVDMGEEGRRVGYIVDSTEGLASASCKKEDVKTAFEAFGVSGSEILLGSGIYIPDPDNPENYWLPEEYTRESARNKLFGYIRENFDIDVSKPLSAESQYIALKFTFDQACKLVKYDNAAGPGGDRSAVPYVVVSRTGEISTEFWTVSSGEFPVGAGISSDENGDQQESCQDIAFGLAQSAEAYQNRVNDLLEQGIETGSTSTTIESEESCTQRAALSFGWAVCGLLEFIASGIEGLMGAVDDLLNIDALSLQEDEGLRTVWSYFRVIATFALLAIGLIMVISQAIGGNG